MHQPMVHPFNLAVQSNDRMVMPLPPVRPRLTGREAKGSDGFCLDETRRMRPTVPRKSPQRQTRRHMSTMIRKHTNTPTGGVVNGISVDDYEMISILGKGSSGIVWGARHIASGMPVALKILTKLNMVVTPSRVFKEKEIMEMLGHHPHIVSLYAAFQTHESLIFVMRYAENGDLFLLLRGKFQRRGSDDKHRGFGEECAKVA